MSDSVDEATQGRRLRSNCHDETANQIIHVALHFRDGEFLGR